MFLVPRTTALPEPLTSMVSRLSRPPDETTFAEERVVGTARERAAPIRTAASQTRPCLRILVIGSPRVCRRTGLAPEPRHGGRRDADREHEEPPVGEVGERGHVD